MRKGQAVHGRRFWATVGATAVLLLSACSGSGGSGAKTTSPVRVKAIAGTDLHQVTMTAKAVERVGLQTARVKAVAASDAAVATTVIPYAALIYDPSGGTWVYTTVGLRTYERYPVTVERVDADTVTLSRGPQPGAEIVTVGAAEVYGSEFLSEHE